MESLIQAVEKRDRKKVRDSLSELNLDSLPFSDSMELLISLIKKSHQVQATSEILELILEKWCDENDKGEIDGVIADLAGWASFPLETLKYLVLSIPYVTVEGILDTHLRTSKSDAPFSVVAERLYRCFPVKDESRDLSRWKSLLETAKSFHRGEALLYIEEKIRFLEPPLPRPSWVERNELQFSDPLSEKSWDENLDLLVETLYESFTSKIRISTQDDEEGKKIRPQTKDYIVSFVATSSLRERWQILHPEEKVPPSVGLISVKVGDKLVEVDPDALYGPLNTINQRECPTTPIRGGCRMLTCCCRNYNDDDGEEVDIKPSNPSDWFTGRCAKCSRKIAKPCYALRFPVSGGGWGEAYCSEKCLIDPVRPVYEEEIISLKKIRELIFKHKILEQ